MEQFYITAGRFVPAEVLLHIPQLQSAESGSVVFIQIKATLQRPQEIIGIVALECETKTAFALFVHRGNSIPQAAGGVNHRHRAVAHGVHLAQTARLTLGGHQVDVTAGIDPGGEGQIKGDLRGDPVTPAAGL